MSAPIVTLSNKLNALESLQDVERLVKEKELPLKEALQFFSQVTALIENFPQYDVVGMDALVDRLRHELQVIHTRDDELNSINKLSAHIQVSRTYLAKFRDGGAVGMNIMNRIAGAFQIRYIIENYDDPVLSQYD
ncbi:MAG TPA: hypothetical protein ENK06_08805 [Gammaproteobacteria bacterium]|nr:hypothetical protein [Gammaproteobacteria bacterium]